MEQRDLEIVCAKIEEEKEFLNSVSKSIWENPELGFQEVHAHDLLTSTLSNHGFDVTKNYILPTAFRAEFSSKQGKGITAALLLEYDALPEIGHGCGHNLISESSLAAGIAIKAVMENDPYLIGKVVLLGTPAEETDGGKITLIKNGAFNDIDIAMMVHPRNATIFAPVALSMFNCTIDFKGKESHAAMLPWEGLNALDAAVTFYQSIGLLRQQIKPSCRLHAIISKGGAAPNVIPSETQVLMFLRAVSLKDLYELKSKIDNCVKGAALSAGCSYKVDYDEEHGYEPLMTNPVLCKLFTNFGEKLGLPATGTETSSGSTDMGNVSQIIPSIHPLYDINTKAINHTKEFTKASSSPEAQAPTLIAAKAMAMTILALFRNPDLMHEVKKTFQTQCGK